MSTLEQFLITEVNRALRSDTDVLELELALDNLEQMLDTEVVDLKAINARVPRLISVDEWEDEVGPISVIEIPIDVRYTTYEHGSGNVTVPVIFGVDTTKQVLQKADLEQLVKGPSSKRPYFVYLG